MASTCGANRVYGPSPGDRVVVAMSGGVDSSVVAYLLKQQGYRIEGMYMRNWDTADERGVCTSDADYRDVQAVCRHLDIPCRQVNFTKEYWNDVFTHVIDQYSRGYTPNPDILCNKKIKFGALLKHLELASRQGLISNRLASSSGTVPSDTRSWIATGHYSRLMPGSAGQEPRLFRGKDPRKDQSYYLSGLTNTQLAKTCFPLGELNKSQVKAIAAKAGLPTAHKKESMGICFVGKRRRFAEFLAEYIPPPEPGPVVSNTGQVVGTHRGIFSFTIGQRARVHHGPHKWFVYAKDVDRNTIYVAPRHDHPLHCIIQLTAIHPSWLNPTDAQFAARLQQGILLQAQVRYNQVPRWCHVQQMDEHLLRVQFASPIRGVAPGQVSLSTLLRSVGVEYGTVVSVYLRSV